MRTKGTLVAAWVLTGLLVTVSAWAAIARVAPQLSDEPAAVLSETEVRAAVASIDRSLATDRSGSSLASPANAPSPSVPTTVGQVAATPSPSSPATATSAPATVTPVTTPSPSAPPSGAPVPTTSAPPPPTTAPTTTSAASAPVAITTAGGVVGVACTGTSTIRLVYATPLNGYAYSADEVTSSHVKVRFTKGSQRVKVEAECSNGLVEAETETEAA